MRQVTATVLMVMPLQGPSWAEAHPEPGAVDWLPDVPGVSVASVARVELS